MIDKIFPKQPPGIYRGPRADRKRIKIKWGDVEWFTFPAELPPKDTSPDSIIMRAAAVIANPLSSHQGLPEMWILDTGCGYDLIGRQDIPEFVQALIQESKHGGIALDAAGGSTRTKLILPLNSRALKRRVEPYVLASSPAVLSLGRRIQLEGYSFSWPAYGDPVLRILKGGLYRWMCTVLYHTSENAENQAALAVLPRVVPSTLVR